MEKDNKRKCGVCEIPHFERNNYFYGKLMTARDFKDEQCYFNEKRWLINRMINGWGVVCGLDVHFEDYDEECIQEKSTCQKESQCNIIIEPGLAIDCCGREILVCERQVITLDGVEDPCNQERKYQKEDKKRYVICLEYNECETEAITLAPSMCSQSEKTNYNRIRDSFKIRLRHASDFRARDYQREFWQLFDRKYLGAGESHTMHDNVSQHDCEKYETLHQYLCEKLREGCPDCVDAASVILAEIITEPLNGGADESYQEPMQQEQQEEKEQQEKPDKRKIKIRIDPCTRRRLVYNNKMLFDLIQCHHDDLPHIVKISWKKYHCQEGVYWKDFVNNFILKGLIVTFDHEMEPATINRHTFFIAFKFGDVSSGTIIQKFIPPGAIEPYFNDCQYKFVVDVDWIKEEIRTKKSELFEGVDISVILRSSLIHNKNGKALDGDFINSKLPTGNGVQGGDFVSWFSVRPKSEK
jgi:hypothetical protein